MHGRDPNPVDPDPEALPDRERPEALDDASEPDGGAFRYEDGGRGDAPPAPPAAGENGNR